MPTLPESLVLSAGDLVLRNWRSDEAAALAPVCGDPAVCELTTVPWTYTPDAARAWIDRHRARRVDGTGLALAVTRGDDGPPLGTVNIGRFSVDGHQAELGYWLVPDARGEGIATVAAQTLAAWGFEQLGLQRIELAILPENVASQRLAARIGAAPEGLRRDAHEAGGRSWDMLIYALTAT